MKEREAGSVGFGLTGHTATIKGKCRRALKGSIALEASFAVPIFIFFIMTLLMTIESVRLQSNVLEAVNEAVASAYEARTSAGSTGIAGSYLSNQSNAYICVKGGSGGVSYRDTSTIASDGIINIRAEYGIRSFTALMPIGNVRVKDGIYAHSFTGYVRSFGYQTNDEAEEYVYVTETGRKYHRDADCTYIKITPMSVDAAYIETGRNRSGGKYYPCERCRPSGGGLLFLTPDGDRYHCDANCSALKRTVYVMPLSEALENGYTACSKCG